MDFSKLMFAPDIKIPTDAEIIFVSDMFKEDLCGGAELTTESLIESSPFKVYKLHSRDVSTSILEKNHNKFWIFGNFSHMNLELIPTIVANMNYSVLEYDYKYCKYRLPELHYENEKIPCNCYNIDHGKLISAFFYGSKSLFWMSEKQKEKYETLFPFLSEIENTVLSSVFNDEFFVAAKLLREKYKEKNNKWIILGSNSWIKNVPAAEDWCKRNSQEYEIIWNLPYEQFLEKMAQSKGIVFLPRGADTCPRFVIEAKLLGCELKINENVEHANEVWFNGTTQEIEEYLFSCRKVFWEKIKNSMNYKPTISGYTTTRNCIEQDYPFEECIQSMLQLCDEVCVVDGESTDGTWEKLLELKEKDNRIQVKQVHRNWDHPRFAVFDGAQKAVAKDMCTKEYCLQLDVDQVIHEDDIEKFTNLLRNFPKQVSGIALPTVEPWGNKGKIRCDIHCWKWYLYKNDSNITHGIELDARAYDENGDLYAKWGDGCEPIYKDSGQSVNFITFYTEEIDNLRKQAMSDSRALAKYEAWYDSAIKSLPSIYHFSWFNLERKIKTYKNYWTRHWNSLHNKKVEDTPENNFMFDCKWADVDDSMISVRAKELEEKCGGWIWHQKWNGEFTPSIKINQPYPKIMEKWIKKNK
jgi:glycosyltransferase involved in cell wall biosynthesis